MNQEKLKKLIQLEKNVDINDEIEWEKIFDEKVNILCENEEDTITFLASCTRDEFDWISNAFEDLIIHFKSKKLLDAIKENSFRFNDLDVSQEIKYAEKAMNL